MTGSHLPIAMPRSVPVACPLSGLTALAFCVLAGLLAAPSAHTQEATQISNCTYAKGTARCDLGTLKSVLGSAKTFAITTSPRDRIGSSQLQAFGASLGKSLALANQPGDIRFVLASIETGGVNYGAMDRELATLKIYSRGSGGPDPLIWVETLSDQPDLPWAAVVSRLLEQLRKRLRQTN